MTKSSLPSLRRKHLREQVTIPCAATPAAAHLSDRRQRGDDSMSFADIAAMPDPEWARTPQASQFWPGRFTVDHLLPAGQLASVPLQGPPRPAPRELDDVDTVTADVLAAVLARPYVRHEEWFAMALAPVAALLMAGV